MGNPFLHAGEILFTRQELGKQAFFGPRYQVTDDVRRFTVGNTCSDTFCRHLSGRIAFGKHSTAARRTMYRRDILFKIVVEPYPSHHRRSRSLTHVAIDAVNIGEQNQQFGIKHTGNQTRQFVVVSKHQLGNAQGIVLIHDGQYTVFQHHGHTVSLVEIFMTGREIFLHGQHLTHLDALLPKEIIIQVHELHLTHCRIELALLDAVERFACLELAATTGYSSAAHKNDIVFHLAQFGNLINKTRHTGYVERSVAIGQQVATYFQNNTGFHRSTFLL